MDVNESIDTSTRPAPGAGARAAGRVAGGGPPARYLAVRVALPGARDGGSTLYRVHGPAPSGALEPVAGAPAEPLRDALRRADAMARAEGRS